MGKVRDEDIRIASEAFHRDGYATIRGAVADSILDEMQLHIDARLDALGGKEIDDLGPDRFTDRTDPFLVRIAADEGLLDIAQPFVGPDIALFSYGYILKSPNDPQPVLWHQDASYWPLVPMRGVTVYVSISSSTPDNGCLRMIPGSHTMEAQPLVRRDDIKNFLHSSIDESLVDEARAVDVLLEPGDVSIHHTNIIHGSNANMGDNWRLSFVINYISTQAHIMRQGWPAYLLRGVAVSGINEYRAFPKFVDGVHMPFRGYEAW